MEVKNIYLNDEDYAVRVKVRKQLLWFGIASLIMMFAGLTSAYIVSRSDVLWVSINPPVQFFYSTAIIVASSLTMFLAVKMAKKGNKIYNLLQVVSLALGLMFCYTQFQGWGKMRELGMFFTLNKVSYVEKNAVYGEDYHLVYKGINLVKEGENYYSEFDQEKKYPLNDKISSESKDAGSTYFILLTGLHVLHVLAGIGSLLVSTLKGFLGKYPANRTLGLELSAYFWHFVDILWILLFGFLLFIR